MQMGYTNNSRISKNSPPVTSGLQLPKKNIIGVILIVALVAFEMFNFDTTRYALSSLLGDVSFMWLQWSAILAIAFCAIDFAGLARLFTPEQGSEEPKAVWYLTGAWLLGATMNAVMTWWAVSLTLLSHEFGNEVLGRETLLTVVPIFVAVLVWLTRILFIGAFSVAGEHLFDLAGTKDGVQSNTAVSRQQKATSSPKSIAPQTSQSRPVRRNPAPATRISRRPAPLAAKPRR